MKKLPISIQTFEQIIASDMVYVDKTDYVHRLVNNGKYYFLSRPRRFGKSLLLSTLKAYFEGKKALFKGLYIDDKEKDWEQFPVVHFDYSQVDYNSGSGIFQDSLLENIYTAALNHDVSISSKIITNAFSELVSKLKNKYGKNVVVLIDEYDKPLVNCLSDQQKFKDNQQILHGFFSSLKGLDEHLRFVILTGVSRFSKISVFSGLNNLDDISMNENYGGIVGFTQKELESNFSEHLSELSKKFSLSPSALTHHIREWYNGFSFDGKTKLYNPFSILKLFTEKEFRNYWFATGTPTYLIDLIKHQKKLPEKFENLRVEDLSGSSMNLDKFPLIPMLYQTGYLTIEKAGRMGIRPFYHLNYPNEEVRYSFLTYVAAAFKNQSEHAIPEEVFDIQQALTAEDIKRFVRKFQSFLSDIPSRLHIEKEAYYHSLVYMVLRIIGFRMLLEKETDKGRIDAVLELPDRVFIIEFKFAKSDTTTNPSHLPDRAIRQIKTNKYYEPYQGNGKAIILVELGFFNKQLYGQMERMTNQ